MIFFTQVVFFAAPTYLCLRLWREHFDRKAVQTARMTKKV
jgi:hypothetical protein